MAAHPIALDHTTFDEFISSSEMPVIVDFWAEWCQPCKAIAPVLERVAAAHSDKVTVAKLDVDASPDLAARYEVMAIPTLIVFKNGDEVKRLRGARSEQALLADITEYL